MSQATLELILGELRNFRTEVNEEFVAVRSEFKEEIQAVKKEQQLIVNRLNSHEELYAQLISMVKSIKESVTDIAERQESMDRKFSFQLDTHSASIEVLNREQLKMKTDIEMLKSRS